MLIYKRTLLLIPTIKNYAMNYSIITIKSNEVPDLPHLKPINVEELLKEIVNQLLSDKYEFIDQKLGTIKPIEGHKTPLDTSETILHICIRESNHDFTNSDINKSMGELIVNNKLKIVQAVRHPYGKYMRIVANLDAEI